MTPFSKTIKCILTLSLLVPLLTIGCTLKRENTGEEDKEAQQTQMESKFYLAKGVEFLQKGDATKGILLLEKSLSLDPNNETTHQLTASAYIQNKQFPKAVLLLSPTLEKFPNNGTLPYLLALSLKETGQLEQAFTAAQRSVSVHEAWQNKKELLISQALMQHLAAEIQKKK